MLYHPLGLGDHVACNGLVRELYKRHDRVSLFCYPQNEPSVTFMYRDLSRLSLTLIRSHAEAERFIFLNRFYLTKSHYDRVLRIGSSDVESGIKYERQFYNSAQVPLSALWDSFFVARDKIREEELSHKLGATGTYLFLHDDARYPIHRALVPGGMKVIEPDLTLTKNIFDYATLLEHAREIHVIDSSFMFLVDCLPYTSQNQRLVVHRYARDNMEWNLPILKKKWEIITTP